tara:strand:+ start:177 stop:875 length:699 start_codon:yes stop_codon:yes gene_type:complete
MDVSLDADPIEFGPSRLNNKIAEVRTFLSQTEKTFLEVSQNLHKYKRDLLVSETQYSLEQTQLMATDPHVRSGRSQQEREALASTQLVHIQSKINDCKLAVHDLEDVLKVIKAKRTDLKDLQGRIRDQLKLCQEQVALGQRWGMKVDRNVAGEVLSLEQETGGDVLIQADSSVLSETEQYVDDLLSTAMGSESLPEKATSSEDVEDFFKSPLESYDPQKVEDFDLDALLDDF